MCDCTCDIYTYDNLVIGEIAQSSHSQLVRAKRFGSRALLLELPALARWSKAGFPAIKTINYGASDRNEIVLSMRVLVGRDH